MPARAWSFVGETSEGAVTAWAGSATLKEKPMASAANSQPTDAQQVPDLQRRQRNRNANRQALRKY